MYNPKDGDHIQLTRVHADGHTSHIVGIISESHSGGFRLTGHIVGGRTVDAHFATDAVFPRSGVTSQTITLSPEVAP